MGLVLGVVIPRSGAGSEAGELHAGEGSHRVLVLKGPIHSDIALPADPQIRQRFGFLADAGLPIDRPDAQWIIVGWGGRSFYTQTPTWADLKPMPVVKTIIGDASVLHVALAGPIDAADPGVYAIDLSDAAYNRLLGAVMASFDTDRDGRPAVLAGAGYGPYDRFFEARGTFHLFDNCNSWTAATLRRAGITTGLWTPLPQLLFLALDLHA